MPIEEEAQATLRDTIESAIEQHSEPETVETPERVRDEAGRFARKQEEAPEQPAPAPEPKPDLTPDSPIEPERKAVPRPSSWKKDYEQDWDTLPDRLREYINEREGQYAKGVSTYKNQWDSAAPIYEAVQPFMADLQQHNINPAQWISNLGNAHRTLVMGSPEQKAQMFSQLATEYGVDLGALVGQPVNSQFSTMAQKLSALENNWNQFQQTQQQQEEQAINKLIADFSNDHPHVEAVYETMTGLLQSGLVTGATPQERLQTAYDKAIRLNDDIWQQQQAEQAKAAEAERQKAMAEKKAKAVSPKSASPTGAMNQGGGKKDLRAQLSEAIDMHLGGHI